MTIWEAKIQYNRLSTGDTQRIDSPDAAVKYLKSAYEEDPTVEWFMVILLDKKNHPIGRYTVSKGTVDGTLVHPREVFKAAILAGASSIIVSHNHPSGDPRPSLEDSQATQKLKEAGKILNISVTDHVIVGNPEADPLGKGYYSYKEITDSLE